MDNLIPVEIKGIIVDAFSKGFAVVLRDAVSNKWLPIYIGPFEAQSIALELEGQKLPRPAAHDLIKIIFDEFNMSVRKAAIISMKDNTYFAILTVDLNGVNRDIDCRPSDAIAIALKTQTPIFVTREILEGSGLEAAPHADEKSIKLRELQEKLNNCIEKENYEEASIIRDKIKEIINNKTDIA